MFNPGMCVYGGGGGGGGGEGGCGGGEGGGDLSWVVRMVLGNEGPLGIIIDSCIITPPNTPLRVI